MNVKYDNTSPSLCLSVSSLSLFRYLSINRWNNGRQKLLVSFLECCGIEKVNFFLPESLVTCNSEKCCSNKNLHNAGIRIFYATSPVHFLMVGAGARAEAYFVEASGSLARSFTIIH